MIQVISLIYFLAGLNSALMLSYYEPDLSKFQFSVNIIFWPIRLLIVLIGGIRLHNFL